MTKDAQTAVQLHSKFNPPNRDVVLADNWSNFMSAHSARSRPLQDISSVPEFRVNLCVDRWIFCDCGDEHLNSKQHCIAVTATRLRCQLEQRF
jgi:hypothetical protein